ncbi:hypothetical protein GK047_01470 [Paenibacillus sp. SYP-B3998]|uniref:Hint domain-containing protein n=2 Tax=Paenibacillus sp. SYP-B3998 TaxID=2678564 RepID=A0A6G3ZRM5_9BACL|nr:hypothetical protein [Paenibacillus sp. SYP-B3998]
MFCMNPSGAMEDSLESQAISRFALSQCFIAGTMILTDNGEKRIENIRVGDKVLAKDDKTGEMQYKEVKQLFQHEVDQTITISVGSEKITTTKEHPFWIVGKGWVSSEDLMVGERLTTSEGKEISIDRIDVKNEHVIVYNFEVQDYHTYFISDLGIWVHNACTTNWKSSKQFGHTFTEHGAKRATSSLMDRARSTKDDQGQWLNNEQAADFLHSLGSISEVIDVDIPTGLGQIITPSGEIISATRARIVPSGTGIKTAFPIK